MDNIDLRRYRFMGVSFVVGLIFLIWVGSFVRSTGSGMGCPDWPKCFGMWIPPTSVDQLPADYQTKYAESYGTTTFNAFKTWTEYINRLITGLISILAILTVVFAFPLRRLDKRIFNFSLAALLLIVLEAVIGAIVVKRNLHTGTITIHTFIALLALIVAISAVLVAYSVSREKEKSDYLTLKPMGMVWSGVGVSLIVLVQMLIGTKVRENVDVVAKALGENARANWVSYLGDYYIVHRIFYYLVAVALMYWVWQLRKYRFFKSGVVRVFSLGVIGLLLCEIAFGISMSLLGIPAVLQPLHLLFAVLIFAGSYIVTGTLYLAMGGSEL